MSAKAPLALAATIALAGCTQTTPKPDTAQPAPPAVVDINAVDYAYEAPDTVAGGWVTFRIHNKGQELHHGSLYRLGAGKTLGDVLELDPLAAAPVWLEAAGGPSAPGPGGTLETTVKLEPGNYVLICHVPSPDGKPHVVKGMAKAMTVVASSSTAAPPVADITVTLRDYGFDLSAPLTAGKHTFRVVSAPGQPHEVVIARLVPGKKAEDFLGWVEKMAGPPPVEGIVGGTTALGGWAENMFTAELTAGDYAIICFIPDAKDNAPHAIHGMLQTITVM